jgi:hypothetical protein
LRVVTSNAEFSSFCFDSGTYFINYHFTFNDLGMVPAMHTYSSNADSLEASQQEERAGGDEKQDPLNSNSECWRTAVVRADQLLDRDAKTDQPG